MSRNCISLCWWAWWKLPPLTRFSGMKSEGKIHGTSWNKWCTQGIPAPGVLPEGCLSLSLDTKPVGISLPKKTYINVSTPSSISSTVRCSVGPRKEVFIYCKRQWTHHLLGHLFFLLDKHFFCTVIHGGGQTLPIYKDRKPCSDSHVSLPFPSPSWFLWAFRGWNGASSTL